MFRILVFIPLLTLKVAAVQIDLRFRVNEPLSHGNMAYTYYLDPSRAFYLQSSQ